LEAIKEPDTGLLGGNLPFARLGDRPHTLVVFPPINDALRDITTGARFLALYYRGLAEEYTIYFVSRRRDLPPGYTTREMAVDYARAFEQTIGPAHVMGLSLGGLVAQRFAFEYPQYVRSLVVGVAAHRLGTEGREIVRRWISRAREERWRELHAEMVVAMYEGLRRPLYETLVRLVGNALVRNPTARSDFIVSAEASATDHLEGIGARTLVIGGNRNRIFPASLMQETAWGIPDSRLRLIEGAGHGAFDERKRDFDKALKEFVSN
jgi:pimeloyl-ACP methyl ester carboxylesterase